MAQIDTEGLRHYLRQSLTRLRDSMDDPGEGACVVRITNSIGFLALMTDARCRCTNRQAPEGLEDVLDRDGVHILSGQMMHNDTEWRTQWLVKIVDTLEPRIVWLDVGLDALDRCSVEVWRQPRTQPSTAEA